MLEAVAEAIAQRPSCRVCIMGHASEEGGAAYNTTLSRERAGAVKRYLTGRGLEDKRMPITGMGERCTVGPEDTLTLDRRVEFIRLDEGQSCPTECTQ